MRLIKVFLLAAGALVSSAAGVRAVHACTAMLKPVDQVIRESETVVRARVVASDPRMRTDPGRITLQVLDVLKGSYDRPFVTVAGQIRDYRSDPARRPPYEQIDCVGRVPGCGDCFARGYKDGAQYLLLLNAGVPVLIRPLTSATPSNVHSPSAAAVTTTRSTPSRLSTCRN